MATIIGAGIVAGSAIYASNQAKKNAQKMGKLNKPVYDSGMALADEGIRDTRRLGDSYEQMLKSGNSVLPASATSVLKRARGAAQDRNVRDITASAARLRQARIGSGGKLSQEAAQEYLTEAEIAANRAAGEDTLAIDTQEAQLELSETNTLRDRLARAREMILGEGRARWSAGLGGQNGAIAMQNASQMEIARMLASFGMQVHNNNTTTPRLGDG